MIAGLRPAEQLVAAERDQRRAVIQRLAGGRLAVQPRRRRPGSHGQFASISPLPMSAITGTPSVASSATVVDSTKPSTR